MLLFNQNWLIYYWKQNIYYILHAQEFRDDFSNSRFVKCDFWSAKVVEEAGEFIQTTRRRLFGERTAGALSSQLNSVSADVKHSCRFTFHFSYIHTLHSRHTV
jgi:hypothetical protein